MLRPRSRGRRFDEQELVKLLIAVEVDERIWMRLSGPCLLATNKQSRFGSLRPPRLFAFSVDGLFRLRGFSANMKELKELLAETRLLFANGC